jgi:hypothetical protein
VTTPAQPSPPGQPPPQQPPGDGLGSAALVLAIGALLAGGLAAGTAALSVTAAIAVLKARFRLSRAAWQALGAVLGMVLAHPPPLTGVIGDASRQTASMNTARRAQYVTAASRRVMGAAVDARAKGEPVIAAVQGQMATEQRYYSMHQAAMWNRARAAGQTDMAAVEHGNLLGWNSVLDSRTSAECRSADGKNYYASSIPDIGLPGSAHPACRCFPSAPHPGGKLLPSRGVRFARAA